MEDAYETPNLEINKYRPSDTIEQKIWKENILKKVEDFFRILDDWKFDSLHSQTA